MATIDQQFVEYIVKTLVNNPENVEVERRIDEKGVLLELSVDPEDVGRVIGRRGATAQSIRTLLRALGTKNDARYNLKIVNTDGESAAHSDDSASDLSDSSDETAENSQDLDLDSDLSDENGAEDDDADDEESSDLAEKTRAELADLDDLDI